jgi:hypothetical protein
MLRLTAIVPLCALALVGCQNDNPLPARHGDDFQKNVIDETWNRALSPADKLNRQDLLDALVGTDAMRQGVDVFSMRSEKRLTDGKVVMLLAFDRARPDEDRFEVSVFDAAGKLVRHERYARDELDEAHRALLTPPPDRAANVPDQPGMAAQRAAYEARWKKITDLLPQ